MGLRIFVIFVVVSILAAVIYGFILVGSPTNQRALQFDKQRISDLQNISFAIDTYWERNEQLPEVLEDLQRQQTFVRSLADPRSGELYGYTILTETTYELCAVFEKESQKLAERPRDRDIWEHGIGETCFEREVQKSVDSIRLPIPAE